MANDTEELLKAWKELFEQKEESYTSKVIYSGALFLVFLSSMIGNILICIVIYYNKTLHSVINYYLFDLAVSDLLVTFSILIDIYAIFDSNLFDSTSGVLTCKVYLCIQTVFLALMWNHGILVITALSIERYIVICHPMIVVNTIHAFRRVFKIILAIWIIALSETLPLIWTMDVLDTGKSLTCYFLQNSTAKVIMMTSLVTTFIIPLGIILFVYIMIAFEVKDHQKFDLKETTICNKGIFKRRNVNKLIVALTVSYAVCWLPIFTFKVLLYFTDLRTVAHYQKTFSIGHKIAMFNCWFTTVLNPLLFSLVSIKFRKALKILWDKMFKGRCYLTKKIETRDKKEDLHGDE